MNEKTGAKMKKRNKVLKTLLILLILLICTPVILYLAYN